MATTIALILLAALAGPAAAQGQGQGNQGQGNTQGPPPQIFADCSSCDESLTPPVYYGCIGDDAYVEYDGVRIDCGAALSLEQTASIPKFYFPNATEDSLYALVMIDTLEIDPIVGTVAPFYPHPIIHYGAVNIPGDVLIDGLDLDKFHYEDEAGIRVRPFVSYQKPVPNKELLALPPSKVEPPPLEGRAFNYEFILGEQKGERDDPVINNKYVNYDFVQFLKKNIVGNPVAATYLSTGFCVNEVEQGLDLMDIDCVLQAETLSGLGEVPARVGVGGPGYTGPGTGSTGGDWFGDCEKDGSGCVPVETEGGEGGGSSAAVNRWSAAVIVGAMMLWTITV